MFFLNFTSTLCCSPHSSSRLERSSDSLDNGDDECAHLASPTVVQRIEMSLERRTQIGLVLPDVTKCFQSVGWPRRLARPLWHLNFSGGLIQVTDLKKKYFFFFNTGTFGRIFHGVLLDEKDPAKERPVFVKTVKGNHAC